MNSNKILKKIQEIEKNLEELKSMISQFPENNENLGIRPKTKLVLKKPLTPKVPKTNENITKLIDFWNNSGLRKHKTPSSKIYKDTVTRLKKIMTGNFFNNIKGFEQYKSNKITEENIITSIKNLALAATNPDYQPNNKYKEYLLKLSFFDFIYNNRSENQKSLFIKYLENRPEKVKTYGEEVVEKRVELTNAIKRVWCDKALNGIKPIFTKAEENNFKKASNKLLEFRIANRRKLNTFILHVGSQDAELATLLFNAVASNVELSKLTTGWLCSDLTFSQRLIVYLNSQGLIIS